ncbi:hypothetical protein EBESD8_57550 [Rhodococcus aetherivorans]|nr:hypothetical protein EBESD8_57550 [Rhodococcus aetherivorans]
MSPPFSLRLPVSTLPPASADATGPDAPSRFSSSAAPPSPIPSPVAVASAAAAVARCG